MVFDDVVQDGRDDGVGVHVQIREDLRRRERMRDVRFAGKALLTFVGLGAELRRGTHALHLFGG